MNFLILSVVLAVLVALVSKIKKQGGFYEKIAVFTKIKLPYFKVI